MCLFDGDDFQFSSPWRYKKHSFLKFTYENIQRYCTPNTRTLNTDLLLYAVYEHDLWNSLFFHILSSVCFFPFRSENRFGNYWNFLNSCIFLLSNGRSFYFQVFLCIIYFLLVFHTATNKLVNEVWSLKPSFYIIDPFDIELNDQGRKKNVNRIHVSPNCDISLLHGMRTALITSSDKVLNFYFLDFRYFLLFVWIDWNSRIGKTHWLLRFRQVHQK